MGNERISVIVPVYNVEKYLPRCVDSLLAQTYTNLEIILVDDGTRDSAGKICDEYAAKDPRIRVIHKENGGLSSARNAGIDIATGEYLAFVDSDDYIAPDTYEAMLDAAHRHGVRLVCAGRFDVEEGSDLCVPGLCPPKEEVISGKELAARIFRWDNIDSAAWDKLYHRDLFRNHRYPVGRICEDVPLTYLLALEEGKAVMLPKRVYYYYHRPDSITTVRTVTPKTFHGVEHAYQVWQNVAQNYPELEKDARSFYVQSVVYILLMLEGTDGFRDRAQHYRRELRRYLPFRLGQKNLTLRNKLISLLLALNLLTLAEKLRKQLR